MNANKLDTFSDAYHSGLIYDFDNQLILNWYPERILARSQRGRLLELGIGHGYTTALFSQHFEKHVVLDGSQTIIAEFKKGFPGCRAELVETYFEDFTTPERFDVIVMGFVLEHVEDPLAILKKYREFLAPDGQLFITVPNAETLNKRVGQAAGLLDDLCQLSDADRAFGHLRLYTLESLKQLVRDAGYGVGAVEGIFLKALTTSQLKQLNLDEKILRGFLVAGVEYPELCVGLLLEAHT